MMINQPKRHILVIEDDAHIAEGLKLNLTMQGYEVTIAEDGNAGMALWKTIKPDLIVLDIMLPGVDGWSILKHIRNQDEKVPVLILSAKSDTQDKIKGLAHGTDDYLGKPFDLDEFLLRVDRLMKRGIWTREKDEADLPHNQDDGYEQMDVFKFGNNIVDLKNASALCRKGKISLTEQEVKLLKLFMDNVGKILSRKKILEKGWGYREAVTTRTVDNFIVRFRKYFEPNPKKPVYFKSRRSLGYIFNIKAPPPDKKE